MPIPPSSSIRSTKAVFTHQGNSPRQDVAVRADYCARAIKASRPFVDWPADAVHALALESTITTHARNAPIFKRGDQLTALHLVAEGCITLGVSATNGKRSIIEIASRGMAYGLVPFLDGGPHLHDVRATERTTLVHTPFDVLDQVLARSPGLWRSLARDAAGRLRMTNYHATRNAFDSVENRLAGWLLLLAQTLGTATEPGRAIEIHLSQESVSELLGVSRQTATLHVRDFAARGLLHWKYGRATILDMPALQRLADASVVDPR